jgi:hypothetical protein
MKSNEFGQNVSASPRPFHTFCDQTSFQNAWNMAEIYCQAGEQVTILNLV